MNYFEISNDIRKLADMLENDSNELQVGLRGELLERYSILLNHEKELVNLISNDVTSLSNYE